MRRIYIHFLTIFTLAFAYTKGTLLSTLLYFIPVYASGMIMGLFALFLIFIYFLTKNENIDDVFSWKKIVKISLLGAAFGYFLQLTNIAIYLKIRHIPINIGVFEDEFYRSVVFLLPCLVVGELVYFFTKKSKWRVLALSVILLGTFGFYLKNLLSFEPNTVYPSIAKSSKDKPNVVLILADDLGLGDLSYNGRSNYQTPNIDRLAAEGINFKNAFCSAPICSPSRAGLLIGEYQQRHGFEHLTDAFSAHPYARKTDFAAAGHQLGSDDTYWWKTEVERRGLDPKTTTIAEFLKEDGYATAAIGKWHVGVLPRYQPQNQGFDYSLCTYSAGMFYVTPNNESDTVASFFHRNNFFEKLEHQLMVYQLFENGKPSKREKEVFTTELFTQEGIDFIEKNKENRFFLYLPYTAVHGPFQAPKRIYDQLKNIENHEERVYASMVVSLDEAVGRIMKKLEDLHLDENTIVIFTSDNGAPLYFQAGTNQPYYGGKMSCFEGGLRVPFVFRWKNHISPTTYGKDVSLMDIFKTVAGLIQKPVPKDVAQDGVNLLPYLSDSTLIPHNALYWRVGYAKAIHKGDWKLDWNEKENFMNLRNLRLDPYETKNLATEYPEKVNALKNDLTDWEKLLLPTRWRHSLDAKVEDGKGSKFYFPW